MKNKHFLKIFLLFFIIIIIIAPVKAEEIKKLDIKINKRPLNLNPIYSFTENSLNINKQIFEGLITYDKNGDLSPLLAKSWEIKDEGKIFFFNLREDVYFQSKTVNGEPSQNRGRNVTAADWKWSFEYLADPEMKSQSAFLLDKIEGFDKYRQGESSEISGIEVIDDYNLKITLEESFIPFLYNFLEAPLVVMPKEDVKNSARNFSLYPVGTGPFYLSEFSQEKLILLKNNSYWLSDQQNRKLPYLDQIEFDFKEYGELNSQLIKKFDLFKLKQEEYLKYNKIGNEISNYNLIKIANSEIYFYAFNFKNQKIKAATELRKKLNIILDENRLLKELNLNNYISASDIEKNYSLIELFTKDNNYNLENNDESLDNKFFNLIFNESLENTKIAEAVKKELNDSKVELNLNPKSWSGYLRTINSKNFEEELFLISYKYENKFNFIYDNFYSSSDLNYYNYNNSRLDTLLDYLKLENRESNQKQAYELLEEIISDQYPFLYLFQGADSYLKSEGLKNADILNNIFLNQQYKLLDL